MDWQGVLPSPNVRTSGQRQCEELYCWQSMPPCWATTAGDSANRNLVGCCTTIPQHTPPAPPPRLHMPQGLTLMDVEATRRLRARLRTPEAQGKAERLMDIVGTISQVCCWGWASRHQVFSPGVQPGQRGHHFAGARGWGGTPSKQLAGSARAGGVVGTRCRWCVRCMVLPVPHTRVVELSPLRPLSITLPPTHPQGRGATLGARQLWARMSGTMRRLRRSLHALLQQVRSQAGVEVCGGAGLWSGSAADALCHAG